jgi:hypothetical protein
VLESSRGVRAFQIPPEVPLVTGIGVPNGAKTPDESNVV